MKKFASLCLALLMLCSLWGCAAQDTATNDASENTQANGSESMADAENTIKIGMSAPLSGANAEMGTGFEIAVQIAMDEINAEGGIDGKEFVLEVMDSQGDAKEASEIAKKFTADEDMLMVIGDYTSTTCMTIAPLYGDAEMVLASPSASNPDFAATNKWCFTLAGRTDTESPFNITYVMGKYLGLDRVAAVYVNNDWGVSTSKYYMERAEEIGMEVTLCESFNSGEKDFAALITKLRQTNPEGLNVMAQATDAVMFVKQVRQLGWDIPISLSGSAYGQQMLDLGGEDVEGCYITSPYYIGEDNEEGQAFLAEFEKRAGFPASANIVNAYDLMRAVGAACQRVVDNGDELTRASFRDEFAATADFEGLSGTFTFSENGDFGKQHIILQVENGEFVKKTDFDYAES